MSGTNDDVTLSVADDSIMLGTGQASEVTNYNLLDNKPSIAGVTLVGNKTLLDLGITQKSPTVPLMDGTASSGSESYYAAGDHVHPHDTTKVDVVDGKGLSTNDFTDALKDKLDAIDGTATSLVTPRTIDGLPFDGTSAIAHYGTCSTAAGTVSKVVSCAGFTLVTGAVIRVMFTKTNSGAVSSLTLNVNSTGAIGIRRHGAELPSPSSLVAGGVYEFVYDGTYWELVGDVIPASQFTMTDASSGIVTDGSGWTTQSQYAHVIGNICMVSIAIRPDTTKAADTTISTVCTIATGYRPKRAVGFSNYYGIGEISTGGVVKFRVIAQVSSSTNVLIGATYIKA